MYDAVSAMQTYVTIRAGNDKLSITIDDTDFFFLLVIIGSFLIWLPKKMFLDTNVATVTF